MSIISKSWWKEAKARWNSKTHPWFASLKLLMVWVFSLACITEFAILYLEWQHDLEIPDIVKYIVGGIVGLGLGSGLTSKLTIHNNPMLDRQQDESNPPAQ